jgi:hypothetical protein
MVYRFGGWGLCQTTGENKCTGSSVGYDLTALLAQAVGNAAGNIEFHKSLSGATTVNILLPIACGISFLATLVAWMSNKFGFFIASFISVLAFIVSLAAMVAEFVIYGMARTDVHNAGVDAEYGAAMWMVLAATIALFLATITSFFQCCCGSRRSGRDRNVDHDHHHNRNNHRVMSRFRRNRATVV